MYTHNMVDHQLTLHHLRGEMIRKERRFHEFDLTLN